MSTGRIYTKVSHVLLAINPHRQLPQLYGQQVIQTLVRSHARERVTGLANVLHLWWAEHGSS